MISVFIPVFNEEKNIRNVIKNIEAARKAANNIPLDVIFVNDASTDKTPHILAEIEKKYPYVRSISHKTNQGIGTGLKEAVKIAKYAKFMIVPGDDDASHYLIRNMFLHRGDAEIIFSYYLNKEIRGRLRNILSTTYGLLYMTIFNVYIQYINGVALYPTKKLRSLDIKSKRFSITAEINIKLLRLGCTYNEIAGYMQTGLQQSTLISLKNVFEVVMTFLRLIYEISWQKRRIFSKKPTRIIIHE